MNVFLPKPVRLQFKANEKFLKRYPFVKNSIDCYYFRCSLNSKKNILTVRIDTILETGILDGPNGVIPSLAEKDGSFAGSIPHDVVWELVKNLSDEWNADDSTVRKFGDELYANTVLAYGGKTWWTRLANRFCYRVAFPFGNFLKSHGLKLPHYTAPLIVILLLPIAAWMFLFNRNYCKLPMIKAKDIPVDVECPEEDEEKPVRKRLVLKPVAEE